MAYPFTENEYNSWQAMKAQHVTITLYTGDDTVSISDSDIVSGSFEIHRACVSGDKIEIGAVVASEITFTLDNSDGKFNGVAFEGAGMMVSISTESAANSNLAVSMPQGYFIVDNSPRKLSQIKVQGLDRMVLFDRTVSANAISFPNTVNGILSEICYACGITLEASTAALPNINYTVDSIENVETYTYRQILSWIAEITGTCAYMDWNGRLRLEWYKTISDVNLTDSMRFSSDILENMITITGVQISVGDVVYSAGSDSYAFLISDNMLISHDYADVAANIFSRVGNFSYYPFSATIKTTPNLFPLDVVTYVKGGNSDSSGSVNKPVAIMNTSYKINTNTVLSGEGETAQNAGYASLSPFTGREQRIIQQLHDNYNHNLNDRIRTVLAFNELMYGAMGLYSTSVTQTDGSTILYLHDRPELENSFTIFTMTSNGIAWTDSGWNDGNPVWQYGATFAGDALFRMLSAEGIHVSNPVDPYRLELTPKEFKIYRGTSLLTSIDFDVMTIQKLNVRESISTGNIRIQPYYENKTLKGTAILFA